MDTLLWSGLIGRLSPETYVCIGLVSVQLTIMAVTLYLHRSQAHGAVVFHAAVEHSSQRRPPRGASQESEPPRCGLFFYPIS